MGIGMKVGLTEEMVDRVFENRLDRLLEWWPGGRRGKEVAELALVDRLLLQNNYQVDFSQGYDWKVTFPTNDATNKLYLHALAYVAQLAQVYSDTLEDRYLNKAVSITGDWHDFYFAGLNKRFVAHIASADHAFSQRALVLLKLLQVMQRSERKDRKVSGQIISLLLDHALWLDDDQHHELNNHGVMADIALFLTAKQLSPLGDPVDHWLGTVEHRLGQKLEVCFSPEGVSLENTPGYHYFNLKLCTDAAKLLEHYRSMPDLARRIDDLRARGYLVFRHMLRPDGSLPPIGDWPLRTYKDHAPINESICYPEGGYAFLRTNDLYLSLKCGYRIPFHKHIDDGSITLHYKGADIIVDGGSYNYDWKDPFRRYFTSCLAHSMIYPGGLQKVQQRDLERRRGVEDARIVDFSASLDMVRGRCEMEFLGRIHANRSLYLIPPNLVLVHDRVTSKRRSEEITQQWLLHPDAVVEAGEKKMMGQVGKVKFNIAQHVLVHEFSDKIGEMGERISGWYSPSYNLKLPCHQLSWLREGRVADFITSIILDSGEGGEWGRLDLQLSNHDSPEVLGMELRSRDGEISKIIHFK